MDYNELSDAMSHLECDGFSQVLAHEMKKQGLKPIIYYGYVTFRDNTIYHNWIVLKSQIYDFRLRMWFGDDAPHGLIELETGVKYLTCGVVKPTKEFIINILKAK